MRGWERFRNVEDFPAHEGFFFKFPRDSLSLGPGVFCWATVQISYYSMHKRHESEKINKSYKRLLKVLRSEGFCSFVQLKWRKRR